MHNLIINYYYYIKFIKYIFIHSIYKNINYTLLCNNMHMYLIIYAYLNLCTYALYFTKFTYNYFGKRKSIFPVKYLQ